MTELPMLAPLGSDPLVAVELYFDNAANEVLHPMMGRAFETAGGVDLQARGVTPHLTLMVGVNFDAESAVDMVCSHFKSVGSLRLGAVGTFASPRYVAFLQPVVSEHLLGLHRGFYEEFDSGMTSLNDNYRPGRWLPHITMAEGVEELSPATHLIREVVPLEITPVRVQATCFIPGLPEDVQPLISKDL